MKLPTLKYLKILYFNQLTVLASSLKKRNKSNEDKEKCIEKSLRKLHFPCWLRDKGGLLWLGYGRG